MIRKLDILLLKRLGGRIATVVLVFYGIILLVESLDAWRFNYLMSVGGLPMAITAILASAARWTIKTLIVTVLLGAIIGILEMQARRELVVIKAAGISIWRIMVAPVVAITLLSLFISFIGETVITQINRSVFPAPIYNNGSLSSGELWLEQGDLGERYILMARSVQTGGAEVAEVTLFLRDAKPGAWILAPAASLERGAWVMPEATRISADRAPERLTDLRMPTRTTIADLKLKYTSTDDFTLFELGDALAANMSDPMLRAAVLTRYARLLTLPLLLTGSLFIAFAFTAGYRRTNKYGSTVLFGIILGFVVFVITEMADRAGASGVLDPVFAAWGPAFIAIVMGVTVLLRKEDGRA